MIILALTPMYVSYLQISPLKWTSLILLHVSMPVRTPKWRVQHMNTILGLTLTSIGSACGIISREKGIHQGMSTETNTVEIWNNKCMLNLRMFITQTSCQPNGVGWQPSWSAIFTSNEPRMGWKKDKKLGVYMIFLFLFGNEFFRFRGYGYHMYAKYLLGVNCSVTSLETPFGLSNLTRKVYWEGRSRQVSPCSSSSCQWRWTHSNMKREFVTICLPIQEWSNCSRYLYTTC